LIEDYVSRHPRVSQPKERGDFNHLNTMNITRNKAKNTLAFENVSIDEAEIIQNALTIVRGSNRHIPADKTEDKRIVTEMFQDIDKTFTQILKEETVVVG
jgi:hypothetical protein